jgi:hypothetical protein
LKITLVITLADRRIGWIAIGEVVGELKRADARVDFLRYVVIGWLRFLSKRRVCFARG